MDNKYIVVIGSISDFSELLPLLCFFYLGKIKTFPYIFTALAATSALNITSFVLSEFGVYNLYLYHLIGIAELLLYYGFYKRNVALTKVLKGFFFTALIIYVLGSLFEGFDSINSFSRSVSCLYLLILGLYYLYVVYRDEIISDVTHSSAFWINAGLLFYFSASFFTFLMSKKILSLEITDFFSAGWLIHMISNIVKNIVIFFAIRLRDNV
ncbi:hypothetical protein GCM10009122_48140 [Fulvivirga kasyanovii]|uniref:hypothetical protein n=1 Tax=Fulvivirga kasyanovii TaxID=396812 RepID=UPI0031D9001D